MWIHNRKVMSGENVWYLTLTLFVDSFSRAGSGKLNVEFEGSCDGTPVNSLKVTTVVLVNNLIRSGVLSQHFPGLTVEKPAIVQKALTVFVCIYDVHSKFAVFILQSVIVVVFFTHIAYCFHFTISHIYLFF